ncbi:MAG: hypothetical protein GXO76_12510 [Calditrichaeota bacterium]|nr:hypothetical protein [Calditrichota bacterium]
MKKYVIALFVGLLTVTLVSPSFAQNGKKIKVNGLYTAWGLSQQKFFFGKNNGNDDYFVQMLRFKIQAAANDNVKAVTRFDIAQGWWGVDNALRSANRPYGAYGGSSLFDFKDTNYLFHVDQAYMEFKVPVAPIVMRVGRQQYRLGNKLVLDNNLDGIQADVKLSDVRKITVGWAKVSEGIDGLSDNGVGAGKSAFGDTDGRDADVVFANYTCTAFSFAKINAFGLYYRDAGDGDGKTYVPDDLQYFRARFTPNISSLAIIGLAPNFKFGKLAVDGEFDYLTGKDNVKNTTFGPKQRHDINNGDISGFNLYLKPTFAATPKVKLGGVFGLGSGDKDVTSGKGNVNKLRTSGFFYVTEIWEDSIMPDEEGITPQGLGAPNTRGYRELENTTLVQANVTLKPTPKVSLFGSYTFIKATQPIHAWTVDANGKTSILADNSTALGTEADFKIDMKIYPKLIWTVRGGIFMPGDAAGYLINGTNKWNDKPIELKTTLTVKF